MARSARAPAGLWFPCALVAAFIVGSAAMGGALGMGDSDDAVAVAGGSPLAAAAAQQTVPVKPLAITPSKATVGSEVVASARELPAGASVELVWQTVEGGWKVSDYFKFEGKEFSDTSLVIASGVVGADGVLSVPFTVPEDYGGVHDVVVMHAGAALAQGGVEVPPSFTMSPTSGPVGTVIEITAHGLGWRTMESTYVVNWDNREVGWVSAVDSRGTAVARFRAAGPNGDHMIKMYTGYMGQSYLNHEQAPTAYMPRPEFRFRTTQGPVPGGWGYAEPYQVQPLPASESAIGAEVALSPTQGPVGADVRLTGAKLPAGTELSLVWETWVGNRVSGSGFEPHQEVIGTVQVSGSGRLDAPLTVPDDLGGRHALLLRNSAGEELARTYFSIETSVIDISPTSGPVGTPVTIRLKGVGWTEYDNIYVATYDNAYMGYACGFNSQGEVTVNFIASGAPGVHLIDFYPGIYKGPSGGQQLYRLPQLSYADDHPGNKIPALRFAFEVTR